MRSVTKTGTTGPVGHNAYAELDVDADHGQRLSLGMRKHDDRGTRYHSTTRTNLQY